MRASSLLLALQFLVTGCSGAREVREPELVSAHVEEARAATSDEAPPVPPSLTAFEAKVLEIRREWDARLAVPEDLLTFHDFSTPEMKRLREEAGRSEFPASLSQRATLDRILAGAFARNPGLQAARKLLAATSEQYAQITYLDNIMRQYVSFQRASNNRVRPAVPMDQVAKRFPFPGTLELKAAIVGHAVEAARAKYEIALRDLVTDIRVAYAGFAFLARAIAITGETLQYLRQLEATALGKLATGAAQKAHVLQTQVEISKLENDVITLRQRRETVRACLNTLLNLPPNTPLAEPRPATMEAFPPSLDALYARASREQPEILLTQARAARMAAMIELAEQATYPDLSPGLAYMEDLSHATGGTGRDREPFSTRPKVKPEPWFGNREAYLREMRLAERAARDSVVAAVDHTVYRVKDAYVQLDTAKRLYELYRDVQIAQAEQAYSDAATGYAADRVEFLNVIDALRRWLRFLLDSDRAVRDYHQAHARLESALGGPVAREEK
ncbi:MAG: TolC family protein [Planctomycetota bacterium]|jgi:outer membrane protein TolC